MTSASPFFAVGMEFRIAEIKGRKSLSRLERVARTRTAMLNRARCCWKERLESTVRNRSNSFSANASSFPFFKEAQPICGTVLTEWPVRSPQSFRGMHSSERIFTSSGCRQHQVLRFFKERDGQFAGDGWEIIKKLVKRVAPFDVINQRFSGDSRSGKAGCSAHDFRVRNHNLAFHVSTIHEP